MDRYAIGNDCHMISELMVTYFNGDISPRDTEAVQNHLKQCPKCRNDYKLFQELQRLDQARDLGAIDPEILQDFESKLPPRVEGNVPTLDQEISELKQINQNSSLSDLEKTRSKVVSIHRFLSEIRKFLRSRKTVKAGKEWLKLEKRRAQLLRRILKHPVAQNLRTLLAIQAEAFVSRGLIFQFQGDISQAETNLSQSVVFFWALNQSEALQTQRFLGELKFYEGDLDSASELFENALKKPENQPREQALLLRNLGNIAYIKQEYKSCRSFLEQAMSISYSLGEPEFPARDLLNLSSMDFHRGDIPQAIDRTREALTLLDDHSDKHLQAQLHANMGTFLSLQNNLAEAQKHWTSALTLFNADFYVKDAIQVMRNMALALYSDGRLKEAETLLINAALDHNQSDALRVQLEILLGRIQRITGDTENAFTHINTAESITKGLGESLLMDAILHEKMFLQIAVGDLDAVRETLPRTTAAHKKKNSAFPSIFDLENEAELVNVHCLLNDRDQSRKSLKRLTRMLRVYRKSNGGYSTENTAGGIPWNMLLKELSDKVV